ncbi:MAG: hypothetical protein HWD59_12410 [Coxiellaceae bacterium]|nr:MAG: hypothetical protein HWD59_12410 [Coxiellaceae bacterium]
MKLGHYLAITMMACLSSTALANLQCVPINENGKWSYQCLYNVPKATDFYCQINNAELEDPVFFMTNGSLQVSGQNEITSNVVVTNDVAFSTSNAGSVNIIVISNHNNVTVACQQGTNGRPIYVSK